MSFPDGTVPTILNVHPTPLYEIALSWAGFAFLWFVLRKRAMPRGTMTGVVLIVMGVERLITEFWRFDSGVYAMHAYSSFGLAASEIQRNAFELAVAAHYTSAGLSLAQIISVAWIAIGIAIVILRRKATPDVLARADTGSRSREVHVKTSP
jgi:prolipoprotein diacylglyceryltransferase